jgi:pimeloyl-ACP methyl ester carboxylesterase
VANFLLIHGGWQGGWCWDQVVKHLAAAGHRAYAPTLRGVEALSETRFDFSLQGAIDGLIADIDAQNLTDLIVVGHSGGGPVAQGVTERASHLVQRIVFVDAWVLRDGECIFDVESPETVALLRAIADGTADRALPMPAELWVSQMCNDLPEAAALDWYQQIIPCPVGWLEQPLELPSFADTDIPAAYVFLDDDLIVDRKMYQRMAGRLRKPTVLSCPGSHEAMLSQPEALADVLASLA